MKVLLRGERGYNEQKRQQLRLHIWDEFTEQSAKKPLYTQCVFWIRSYSWAMWEKLKGRGGHTKKPPSLLWNNIMWQSLIYYTGALDMLWCALYLGWMLSNISLNKILIAYGKQSNFSNSSDKKSFIIFRRIDRPTTDRAAQRPAREYEIRCAKNMRW